MGLEGPWEYVSPNRIQFTPPACKEQRGSLQAIVLPRFLTLFRDGKNGTGWRKRGSCTRTLDKARGPTCKI